MIVQTKALTKYYKGKKEPAINNLELEINENAFFGLLGPNGAGKTTTISILSGLLSASSGEIFMFGERVVSHRKYKPYIGVVGQDIALYEKLTIKENLDYFGSFYSLNKVDLKNKIQYYLEKLGLEKFRNEQIRNLSGGIKRRTNLIAGLLHDPKLLFLDEPTVGVDVQSRNLIREFLKELNQSGITIVYSSHILEDAELLCSDIAIVDNGELILTRPTQKLLADHPDCDRLEEVFLKYTGKPLRD